MATQDAGNTDLFFSLLRSGMYGIPLPESQLPESIDWEPIVKLAKKQVTLGIIIDSVQMLPERLRPTGDLSAKMNRFALGLIQTNIILDKTVARLVSFLSQHGIEGVLLKGQGVARYYRSPQMRQCGDIDFYVGKKQYKKAVKLCREYLMGDKNDFYKTEQHFVIVMDGVLIELHRLVSRIFNPFRNRRLQNWVADELECSPARRICSIGDKEITLPSVDFDALFIFHHAWHHYIGGGIGLRQLCDWAMIMHAHGRDIDTARLKRNLQRFGLTKGWKLFACIAVNHLGVSEDKIPLYDPSFSKKSEELLAEIISGGNFGRYTEAYSKKMHSSGLRRKLSSFSSVTKRFIALMKLMPVEATFYYIHTMCTGIATTLRKTMS